MKQFFRIAGLALLCCGLLSACTETEGPNLQKSDTLTIQTIAAGPFSLAPTEGSSVRAERILAQYDRIWEEYGCKVTVSYTAESEFSSRFLRTVRADVKFADVIQTSAGELASFQNAGALASLTGTGLEEGRTLTQNGEPFAFRADAWGLPLPTLSYGVFYNRTLLREADCDPLELYEQDQWNTDTFSLLCQAVPRTEGTERPISAFITPTAQYPDLIFAVFYAFGGDFIQDGQITVNNQAAFEGMNYLSELLRREVSFSLPNDDETVSDQWAFGDRRTAFLITDSSLLFDTAADSPTQRLGEDIAWLPFPTGTTETSRVGGTYSVPDLFCALTAKANWELCAQILPELFGPLEGETETTADTLLVETYFFTETEGQAYLTALDRAGTDSLLFLNTEQRTAAAEILSGICNQTASAALALHQLEERLTAE